MFFSSFVQGWSSWDQMYLANFWNGFHLQLCSGSACSVRQQSERSVIWILGLQILSSERKLLWLVESRKLFLKEIRQEKRLVSLVPHHPPDGLGAWPSGTEAWGRSPSHCWGRRTKPRGPPPRIHWSYRCPPPPPPPGRPLLRLPLPPWPSRTVAEWDWGFRQEKVKEPLCRAISRFHNTNSYNFIWFLRLLWLLRLFWLFRLFLLLWLFWILQHFPQIFIHWGHYELDQRICGNETWAATHWTWLKQWKTHWIIFPGEFCAKNALFISGLMDANFELASNNAMTIIAIIQ